MRLWLGAPWLLAPAVLACLVAVLILRRSSPEGRRRARWAGLQVSAVLLTGLALAQPTLGLGPRPATVLALDRSAATDPAMRRTELAWARAVTRDGCVHPCRVVDFAATPKVLRDSRAAIAAGSPTGREAGATDLESALHAALATAPRDGRVVVLSSGVVTTGDALATVPSARRRHQQVDLVSLAGGRRRDAAVTSVQGPAIVRAGDPIPLLVTVRSSVAGPATLSVSRPGSSPSSERVRLRVGDNPYLLSYTAGAPGWATFLVRIGLPGDTVPQNDALGTATRVLAAPRVLLVGDPGAARGQLATALRHLGLVVEAVAPASLPDRAPGFRGLDSVVLDDVPAAQLAQLAIRGLSAAVRTGGLGLVVLGGPHSFSLGGYAHSTLEPILPVSSLTPGNLQRRNVAIELVLDHSGSMIDLAGGVPKIDMVHVAGEQTARFIAVHHDDLGIVDFDVAAHILVPMQTVTPGASARRVSAAVAGLQANGGTDIYAGLEAGARQLQLSRAPEKHLILMTDGISQPEDYAPVLRQLRREHIEVATVALGTDADRTLLGRIAAATGGHAYVTDDARQLPAIFARETAFAAKPVRVRGPVAVGAATDTPVVRSLAGQRLPTLDGDVVTTLAPGALADLLGRGPSGSEDPVLAQWQVGLGRVVAWTPGVGRPWAAAWAHRTALWNDIVRWADRAPAPPAVAVTVVAGAPPVLQVDLSAAGAAALDVPRLSAALTAPSGAVRRVGLAQTGPLLYRAPLAGLAPGLYRIRLAAAGAMSPVTAAVAVPYSSEDLPRPPGESAIGEVVAQTGGRVLPPADPAALGGGGRLALWWWLSLAALALFVASALGRLVAPRSAWARTAAAVPIATGLWPPRPGASTIVDQGETVGAAAKGSGVPPTA